ncbi:Thymidylate kinase [Carbonactinospora thermoautotrophica]|uniref:Thymidylate kinase n=1 Tax=Carbonactinospora thermoautotrophica TaxID=1469144 RepID=A0A132MLX4_9ACTN|nr:Thymidylate kinase [Carbonactinospora thermoautotrophica]
MGGRHRLGNPRLRLHSLRVRHAVSLTRSADFTRVSGDRFPQSGGFPQPAGNQVRSLLTNVTMEAGRSPGRAGVCAHDTTHGRYSIRSRLGE